MPFIANIVIHFLWLKSYTVLKIILAYIAGNASWKKVVINIFIFNRWQNIAPSTWCSVDTLYTLPDCQRNGIILAKATNI
jgi:hypothetical protein